MVINILKNGTEVSDLTGHVVTSEDAPAIYRLLEQKGDESES